MSRSIETKGIGVLLTDGYNTTQLDSLQQAHEGIAVVPYKENRVLQTALDSIGSLYVLGNGVAAYDFWQLEDVQVQYVEGAMPSGIVMLRYNDQLLLGDSLIVQGLYNEPVQGGKLILQDAGGNALDSISMSDGDAERFRHKASTAVAGKFLYSLVEKDSLDVIIDSNPIPVIVKSTDQLDILIVNTFPTFETKYLKNFLAENGHKVLVRSQLTKDRFKFENFNRKRGTIYGFTRENLESFDLVILDGNSFLSTGGTSKRALETAMREDGLGVFVQPDGRFFSASRDRTGFRFTRNKRSVVRLGGWPKIPISTYNYSFENNVLMQPTITSGDATVVVFQPKGEGRLGTSLLQDTYQLVLDGHQDTYRYIWSKIMTDLGKRELAMAAWEAENLLTYPDEPFHFNLRTAIERPEVVGNKTYVVPLEGHIDLEDFWKGVVYPKESGWNQLTMTQDSTAVFDYYVMDGPDWRSLYAFKKIDANKRFFKVQSLEAQNDSKWRAVPQIWFFLSFIICIGILWILPKWYETEK